MLVPAVLYKDEIEKQFAKRIYDNDMFYYQGYTHGHELTEIKLQDNLYQWAIIGKNDNLIGYFSYRIDPASDNVYNFGFYSFDKGNALVAHDVFKKMKELIKEHHRVEWRGVGGNPALEGYKNFVAKIAIENPFWIVKIHKMIDVTKDNQGNYHDEYIFEILKGKA